MNAFRQAIRQVAPRALGSALLSTTTTRLPNTAAIRTLIVATSATPTNKLNPGLHKKLHGTRGVGGEISNYLNRHVKAIDLPDKKDKEGSTTYPQPRHRATASTCRSMSTAGTQGVGGEDEISKYLSRNVDAVVLPGKLREQFSTYPPLILDAASGTGKTQQAFALVKEHKSMVYFLLSDALKGEFLDDQRIYQRMRDLTRDQGEFSFASRVDEAIGALCENKKNKDEDICAVKFLHTRINRMGDKPIDYKDDCWVRNAGTDDKALDLLMDVVLWMCSKRLQYDDGVLRVVPIQNEGKTSCKFEDLYSQLTNIILFVDEALPKIESSAGDEPDPGAIDRLRFVRNLGRALTMKVVLAGTAATAANMIAVKAKWVSRASLADMAWIECHFLWTTMSQNDVKEVLPTLALPDDLQPSPNDWQKDLIPELARSRPYLVYLFGRVMNWQHIDSDNLPLVLENVGNEIRNEKRMSDESNLVYLMGPFLDRGHTSPCAFPVKPAALVRGHFFEPCVVVDSQGNPVFGLLMGKRSLASGQQRIRIYRRYFNDAEIMWCASMGDDDMPRAAFCWDFSGIEYSLSACVQQCLAREPLLAVALSTEWGMDKNRFRKALSKVCQGTIQQRAGDATDGDLHELILFAVLQLASNCQEPSKGIAERGIFLQNRVKLGTFLQNIEEYLTAGYDESFAKGVVAFRQELQKYELGPSKISLNALLGTREDDFVIEWPDDVFKEYAMPWLVPACSLEALENTRRRAPSLFDGLEIAALVPGLPKAPFDASVYSCKKLGKEPVWEFKDVAQPEWVFEFKARATTYTTGKASGDLKTKCVNLRKNQPKNKTERRETDDDELDELECHAMLIAVTGGLQSSCKIVYSDGPEKYLRVALVVGLGREQNPSEHSSNRDVEADDSSNTASDASSDKKKKGKEKRSRGGKKGKGKKG